MFELHPRLDADTLPLGELALCELRLMNDRRFPWIILVPRLSGLTEIHQLRLADQHLLIAESSLVSEALMSLNGVEKINTGALGNVVPQLHWHVVGRHRQDSCWPGPVWGCGQNAPWDSAEAAELIQLLREKMAIR